MYYINGRLGDKDPSSGIIWIMQAIEIWEKKAQKRDIESATILGSVYYDGDMGISDYHQAFKWFSLAARSKDSEAMLGLAKLHLDKYSGYLNVHLAIKSTQQMLDNLSYTEKEYLRKDIFTVINDLAVQENLDIPPSIINSLNNHYEGHHLFKITNDNLSIYKHIINTESADQYSEIAEKYYKLGIEYLKREDEEQNILHAAFWLRKANNKGSLKAGIELAKMYEQGLLGDEVRLLATKFYKQAYDNCSPSEYDEAINTMDIYSFGLKFDEDQVSLLGE